MGREYKKWVVYTGKFFQEEVCGEPHNTSKAAIEWLERNGYKYYDVYQEYWNTDLCTTGRVRMITTEVK